MRNGQNKRMRGRNRKSHNPLTRVYESNGPDVKIRGTANHVAEKYLQLARDAQASGDPVAAENYYQHAEHYFRMIATAQEQFRQTQPLYRPEGGEQRGADEGYEDGDEEGAPITTGGHEPFGTREPQPYLPRDAQPFPAREAQPYQGRESRESREHQAQEGRQPAPAEPAGLPAFITGGAPAQPHQGNGANGFDGQPDRFPLHRRRRRHRGPRGEGQQAGAEGGDESRNND
jgi:hypothetical protein